MTTLRKYTCIWNSKTLIKETYTGCKKKLTKMGLLVLLPDMKQVPETSMNINFSNETSLEARSK